MATYATEKITYTPAPEGVHQAVCCDVKSAFNVERTKKDGSKFTRDEVTIVFQLATRNPDNDNKPFIVRSTFGLGLSTSGTLRPFLEAWRGKKFTKEELAPPGFDVDRLIGANANVNIVHNGSWANIASIMPLTNGQAKIAVENYVRESAKVTTINQPAKQAEITSANSEIPVSDDDCPF